MTKPKVFVSHVVEEADLAHLIKTNLLTDFLGLVDVFVSSDIESISAGANWLKSLEQALHESSVLLVLCSYASIGRPWVNFEVGAAWIKAIPIVPFCHTELIPSNLPMPFSLLQAVSSKSVADLTRMYSLVAKTVGCQLPKKDFSDFVTQVGHFEERYTPIVEHRHGEEEAKRVAALRRIYEALRDPQWIWRFVDTLAAVSGLSEDEVVVSLIPDGNVELGKDPATGKRMARLRACFDIDIYPSSNRSIRWMLDG